MSITPEQAKKILDAFDARQTGLVWRVDAIRAEISRTDESLVEVNESVQTMRQDLEALLAEMTEVPPPPSPVPLSYDAPTDRMVRTKPPLPTIGGAGSTFTDPAFGRVIRRMTDGNSVLENPAIPGRSFRTPSSVHARAWNADSSIFYVVSTHGNVIPFAADTGKRFGGELRVQGEPNFHPVDPLLVIGAPSGATNYWIVEYNLADNTSRVLLDLQGQCQGRVNLASPRTYVGDTGISGDGKRVFAFYGGTGQDKHFLISVKDLESGSIWTLDTMLGTLNGLNVFTENPMRHHIHAANMDKSGRWIKISWASADVTTANPAPPSYWDIESGTFAYGSVATGGHDAYGYGVRVNQSGEGPYPYDAAQWQLRRLDDLNHPLALINPVLTPKAVYLADHPSWHNAQPDRLVPFITGLYRYGAAISPLNPAPWRAWDDEIIAVQTNMPGNSTVWRFCHHRSDVSFARLDGTTDYARTYFWAQPHPQVSPNGRRVIFTSNMERSLGVDPKAEDGGRYRQDVFMVELAS